MAEFIDEVRAPGDYQRPVATKTEGPDIFGAAAKLWSDIGNLGKGGGGGAESQTAQRNLLEDMGLDLFSRGASEIMTGRPQQAPNGENILELFGADAKTAFEEIKRIDAAAKEGEMTPQVREIMLERLVSGVMGSYPEASYEIMGQALSQLGVDHAYARHYKYTIAQQDQAEKDTIARDSYLYDLGVKAGFGYERVQGEDGRYFLREAPRDVVIMQGMVADEVSRIEKARELADKQAAAKRAAEAAGNKALAAQITAAQEVNSYQLTEKAIQIGSVSVGNFVPDLLSLTTTAGVDPQKNEAVIQLVQKAKADLATYSQTMTAKLSGAWLPKDSERFNKWVSDQNKALDDLLNGPASNLQVWPKHWDMMQKSGQIEASQIAPVYSKMLDIFGQGMVSDILNLRIPGVGPQQTELLRNDILRGLAEGSMSAETAKARVMEIQSVLKGTNIPQEPDPAKRARAVKDASISLYSVLPRFSPKNAEALTSVDLNNFNGATVSLLSAGMSDSPTITLDNAERLNVLLFSPQWRGAAVEFGRKGDPQVADNMNRYNTVLAAAVLDTLNTRYTSNGMVEFDKTTLRYVPVAQIILSPLSARQLESGRPQSSFSKEASPEAKKAAAEMNKLLDHLEFMDKSFVQVVPKEALQTKPDADGKTQKISLREAMATQEGMLKSIQNYADSIQGNEALPTSDSKFWDAVKAYRNPFNVDTSSIDDMLIKARMDAVNIRTTAASYKRPTDVPVKDMQSYMAKVNSRELGGERSDRPHYTGPDAASTARGSYGFVIDTWNDTLTDLVKDGLKIPGFENMTKQQRFDLMKDPVLEDKVMEEFTLQNIDYLRKALGRDVSWEEVDMAHVFGKKGASEFISALEANPNTKASKVMNPKDFNANRNGLTKGDPTVLQVWNRRTGRDDGTFQAYMNAAGYVGSYEAPRLEFMADIDDIELGDQ